MTILLWTAMHRVVITVKVCLYRGISWEKPTFAEFRITSIGRISDWKRDKGALESSILYSFCSDVSNLGTQLGDSLLFSTTSVKAVWTDPTLMYRVSAMCLNSHAYHSSPYDEIGGNWYWALCLCNIISALPAPLKISNWLLHGRIAGRMNPHQCFHHIIMNSLGLHTLFVKIKTALRFFLSMLVLLLRSECKLTYVII